MSYVEWGTRLALHNSQPGATVTEHAPVPAMGLGRGTAISAHHGRRALTRRRTMDPHVGV
jgi:hypothetical protein